MSKGLTSVVAMQDGGFFGDPGDSPEAYSPSSYSGPSGPEAAAGGPDPFDRPSSSGRPDTSTSGSSSSGSTEYDPSTDYGFGFGQDVIPDVADAYSKPEEERSWVEKKLIEQYEDDPANIGMVQTDDTGRITGYTSPAKIPGILTGLASLFGTPMVYTGFGRNPFAAPDVSSDDERPRTGAPASVAAPAAAVVEPTVSVPPSYYATGAGTGTMSLAELANVQPYLATLYASTSSPIGQNYEELLRRIKKQEKDRRRLSGLDIFKPVSTVT